MVSTSDLLEFYLASGTDSSGRTFEDVLALDLRALESNHDFIQWIFPLRTSSAAVPDAPVLDDAAIEALRQNPVARERALRALRRMLAFYGIEFNAADPHAPVIARAASWATRH